MVALLPATVPGDAWLADRQDGSASAIPDRRHRPPRFSWRVPLRTTRAGAQTGYEGWCGSLSCSIEKCS